MFFMFGFQFVVLIVGLGLGTSTLGLELGNHFGWAYYCEEPNAKKKNPRGGRVKNEKQALLTETSRIKKKTQEEKIPQKTK